MNFTDAIRAHSDWRLRLVAHCRGTAPAGFDAAALSRDNACELGKWLHGDGRRHAADPKFKQLIAAHAAMHLSGGAIADLALRGRGADADALIRSPQSDFNKLCQEVVGSLMAMRERFGDNG